MNTISRRSSEVLLMALLAGGCYAQDANQILTKVGESYRAMTSYHFEGKITAETDMGGANSRTDTEFTVAYASPDQFRVEFNYPTAGDWVRVSDGKTYTAYRSLSKQLDQSPASIDSLRVLRGSPIASFEELGEGRSNATVIGSEPVTVDGKPVDCYVIQFDARERDLPAGARQLPTKVWVDKARLVVLRRVTRTESQSGPHKTSNQRSVEITSAHVNEPVAPTLFAFDRDARH